MTQVHSTPRAGAAQPRASAKPPAQYPPAPGAWRSRDAARRLRPGAAQAVLPGHLRAAGATMFLVLCALVGSAALPMVRPAAHRDRL
jgi:hypothetical protein